MSDRAHGIYSIDLSDNLVIVNYSDGFNVAGVKALTEDILSATKHLKMWVLYQKPDATAGIVKDAIEEMYVSYLRLQKAGCLAVGIVNRSIFVDAGDFCNRDEMTLPIFIYDDEKPILEKLNTFLD